ncbi:MAG TPA: hypothetical protein VN085_06015 [Vicinamibacterales bacterium]|nr:hypothetical protein [Vicinamibacterales bacterium]
MPDLTKKGNLSVVPGALYGHFEPRRMTADEWLERETRSLFASWKADEGDGAYASRGIANAAQSINFPHRILARRIREARAARVKHDLVRQLGMLLTEYADRLYANVSDTPQRPDPVQRALSVRRAA